MNNLSQDQDVLVIPKWIPLLLLPLVIFLLIGSIISPVNAEGKPIILSPEVKAIEEYRAKVERWHDYYVEIDQRSEAILLNGNIDLFTTSQDAQGILDDTLAVIRDLQQQKTPSAAIPARDIIDRVGEGYFLSSRAILKWVAAPNEENYKKAINALQSARNKLIEMEQSQWLTR